MPGAVRIVRDGESRKRILEHASSLLFGIPPFSGTDILRRKISDNEYSYALSVKQRPERKNAETIDRMQVLKDQTDQGSEGGDPDGHGRRR
jgi:hypothetical protein